MSGRGSRWLSSALRSGDKSAFGRPAVGADDADLAAAAAIPPAPDWLIEGILPALHGQVDEFLLEGVAIIDGLKLVDADIPFGAVEAVVFPVIDFLAEDRIPALPAVHGVGAIAAAESVFALAAAEVVFVIAAGELIGAIAAAEGVIAKAA